PAASTDAGRPSPSPEAADVRGVTFRVELPPAREMSSPAGPGQAAVEDIEKLAKAEVAPDLTVSPTKGVSPQPASDQSPSAWPVAAVLAAVWLLGVLFCLSRSLRHLVVLYRCSWRAREVVDRDWTGELASLARRDGLRAVSLKESPAIASPL